MRFEHLLEINDINNPFVELLTRDQLWAGLLFRVENPEPFLPGLERCEVLSSGENWLERLLDFGPASIRDRVTLVPGESTHYEIAASESHAGGSLTIRIEARSELDLYLRFIYTTHHPAAPDDAQYDDYVKSAYQQSNIDTVRLIREMAAEGKLIGPLH
ncbi:MAG: hypothetical protein RIR18_567 [Pseudomonadota bacterium]|jgi:hypothetical protein